MIEKIIIIITLFNYVLSKTIKIAPEGNTELADYYCDGIEDEYEIQKAICELKGFNIDTDYASCGKYNAFPDNDPIIKLKGGTIHLLQGTFNISQNIRLYSNQILEGEGMDLTTIRLSSTAPELPNSGIIRMENTDNNIIQDFTIDGNKDSDVFDGDNPTSKYRYGVYTQESTRIHMRRVRAYNCPGYGFDPHGVPGEPKSTDYMIIENCYAEDNNLDGFTVDKSYYVTVTNNWAINNHRNGFELTTGAVGVHITNNHAINNGVVYATRACGIKIQDQHNNGAYWGTEYSTVSNNYIEGSGTDGICVVESSRTLIDSNIIRGSQQHCIRLRDTSYDGSNGSPNGDSGKGSDDSIISNNICIDNTFGLGIEDSARVTVTGNRVGLNESFSDYGIVIKRSNDTLITSNNLCGTSGVEIQGSNRNVLEFNNLVCDENPSEPPPETTPAPTTPPINITDLEPITVLLQNVYYDYDDDRIIDTWKQQNGDFLTTDISSWANGYQLVSGATIQMKVNLTEVENNFYPVRFEYTSMNTNNNHGIIFNWPTPENGWVNGWNTVHRVIENDDYYGTPDWTDMDRFQLYHANREIWNGEKSISLEIKVCDINTNC